jgi:hypothetical protein
MEESSDNNKTNRMLKEDEDRESLFSGTGKSSPSRSRSRSRRSKDRSEAKSSSRYKKRSESEEGKFIMKNGCCRDCMRAFSKSGKSCLCQVPKYERNYTLPEKGCNFCGCNGIFFFKLIIGCNPVDVRREKRKEQKKQLKDDKNILYKKQRLLDSDDEDLKVYNIDADEWNNKRKDFERFLSDNLHTIPYFTGFGIPMRTQSYILGYTPGSAEELKNKRNRSRRNRNLDS